MVCIFSKSSLINSFPASAGSLLMSDTGLHPRICPQIKEDLSDAVEGYQYCPIHLHAYRIGGDLLHVAPGGSPVFLVLSIEDCEDLFGAFVTEDQVDPDGKRLTRVLVDITLPIKLADTIFGQL